MQQRQLPQSGYLTTLLPALPPVPAGLREDTSNLIHPASTLLSPVPKRPAGGAVDTGTTRHLERAASANLLASASSSNNKNMAGTTRIEQWRTSSAQPGFADYAVNARTPSPAVFPQHPQQPQQHYAQQQQQQQYPAQPRAASYYPPPANGPDYYNAPTIALHASPQPMLQQTYPMPNGRPVSNYSPAPSPGLGPAISTTTPQPGAQHPRSASYSSYDSRQSLHHSFSDLSLGNSVNGRGGPNINGIGSGPPASTSNGHVRASTYGLDPSSASGSPGPRSRRASYASTPAPDVTAVPPTLCIALPSQAELTQQREAAKYADDPASAKVAWSKAVLKFVERHQASSSGDDFGKITDPTLVKWTDEAIRSILSYAETAPPHPEALYLRGELSNSGKFPSYRSKDTSAAFRDFETAANMGYYAAWAKIALAYETFGEQNHSQADVERAKKAYEEGVKKNEVTCTYRMAMAHMLGQLGLQPNSSIAVPMLRQAASLSTTDDPLPAYIYGMLLSGELDLGDNPAGISPASIPPSLLANEFGQPSEPRPWIERSAYLGYAPAQFKIGFCYEYASLGCPYDPLLSVQYYSLASQQGDMEADMALSKWFLCGSEAFDLQENLAFTFAEKAAKKGLPSAEFALGYYHEIGIGGRKDMEMSKRWYTKAAAHGNTDAADRLAALANDPAANQLDRSAHESQINDKIVRKRTQAKAEADTRRSSRPPRGSSVANLQMPQVMPTSDSNSSLRRKETMKQVEEAASYGRRQSQLSQSVGPGGVPGGFAVPQPQAQHSSPQAQHRQTPVARQRDNSLAAPAGPHQRYSLVDSGYSPAPTPSNVSSAPSASSSNSGSGVQIDNRPQAAIGPQTFEAMGLKTGKVKPKDECIIC